MKRSNIVLKTIKEHKIVSVISLAVLVVGIIIMGLACLPSQLKRAIDADNKAYDRIQIEITRWTRSIPTSEDVGFEDEVTDDTETAETGETTEIGEGASDVEERITLKKEENIYYEDGVYGEYYYYERDGKSYVKYREKVNLDGDSEWKESVVADSNQRLIFDFTNLDKIEKKFFEKKDDNHYTVRQQYLNDFFYAIMNIPENEEKLYAAGQCEIVLKDNVIESMTVNYTFNEATWTTQIYEFVQEDVNIEIP